MRYGLGVDLGTTYTAAAVAHDGRPSVVALGDRSPDVPSVAFLREDGELLVGEPAVRRGGREPHRLAQEFKRQLGDPTPVVLGGAPVTAETLTGHLLRWVVEEVVQRQGAVPDRLVLTFPATWGPHRTRKLAEAVETAGVGPVETCPEPVAAALHFASTERVGTGETVAVYDLGGGTFDAAVLRNSGRGFELLGTPGGLEQVGGADFDEAVFGHVVANLGDALAQLDPDDPDVTEGLLRLRRECTEAKEHLSSDTEVTVDVRLPGLRRAVRLTRPEFEDMIRPTVAETVACLRRALRSAGVAPDDLAAVVLVGGSSRVPLVSQLLGHDLGRPVTLSPAPRHAVALGAALVAARLAERESPPAPIPPSPTPPSPSPTPGPPTPAPPTPAPPTPGPRRHGSRWVGGAGGRTRDDRRLALVAAGGPLLALVLALTVPTRAPSEVAKGQVAALLSDLLADGTLLTAVLIGAFLFLLAYVESLLRGVRRRRRARSVDVLGMTVLGALAGVVLLAAASRIGRWTVVGVVEGERDSLLVAVGVLASLATAAAAGAVLVGRRAARRGPRSRAKGA